MPDEEQQQQLKHQDRILNISLDNTDIVRNYPYKYKNLFSQMKVEELKTYG